MIKKHGKNINSTRLKKLLNKQESVNDARDFALSLKGEKTIDKCPCCSSDKHKSLTTIYGFNYNQCSHCKLVFVINQPNTSSIEQIYNSEYYNKSNTQLLANDTIIDFRVNNIAKPKFDYIQSIIQPNKKTWLDIGCGVGEMLKVARDNGYKALGIEINQIEVDYAKDKLGLNISTTYLTEETVNQYIGYSVISMFGVLEHIPDFQSVIKSISKAQKEGDYLILEVPHFSSLSSLSQIVFPNDVNRVMHPPFHLYLFNLKSLSTLLSEHGYKISHSWYFGQDFFELLSTLELHHKNLNSSLLKEKLINLTNAFQQIIDENELSDEILVVAQKNNS